MYRSYDSYVLGGKRWLIEYVQNGTNQEVSFIYILFVYFIFIITANKIHVKVNKNTCFHLSL